MTRSRRRSPYIGITTAESDKPYKQTEHRRERRNARQRLQASADGDHPKIHRSYGDPWGAPKDGKQTVDRGSKWMRK